MRAFLNFLFLVLSLQFVCAQQLKLPAIKDKSTITYSMVHPLHKWDGISREVSSVILTDVERKVISQVAVSVKLATFDSQNANRDSHMLEVTEGIKFPSVTFSGSDIQQQGDKLIVKGKLTFHGVSKDLSFSATRKTEGKNLKINGEFNVKMSDFNIPPPSLLGLATEDEFKVRFEVVY